MCMSARCKDLPKDLGGTAKWHLQWPAIHMPLRECSCVALLPNAPASLPRSVQECLHNSVLHAKEVFTSRANGVAHASAECQSCAEEVLLQLLCLGAAPHSLAPCYAVQKDFSVHPGCMPRSSAAVTRLAPAWSAPPPAPRPAARRQPWKAGRCICYCRRVHGRGSAAKLQPGTVSTPRNDLPRLACFLRNSIYSWWGLGWCAQHSF